MMDVIAPESPMFEQEFSDASGRKKYRRTKASRDARRAQRKSRRGARRSARQALRQDIKSGKTTRQEARQIRKNWRRASVEELKTAVKQEFDRIKATWDENKKRRQAKRSAIAGAPRVTPLPPRADREDGSSVVVGEQTNFVKKLNPIGANNQKTLPNGGTETVDAKNIIEVPAPNGGVVRFDRSEAGSNPIKQNAQGEGAIILPASEVELVADENGIEDFYHTADIATDGWWKSLPTWGKVGVIAGALTIGVLGTWGIVKLVQKGKKGK